MSKYTSEQREICCRYGSDIVVCDPAMKVGIALETIDRSPLNALRHTVLGDATGWFPMTIDFLPHGEVTACPSNLLA